MLTYKTTQETQEQERKEMEKPDAEESPAPWAELRAHQHLGCAMKPEKQGERHQQWHPKSICGVHQYSALQKLHRALLNN